MESRTIHGNRPAGAGSPPTISRAGSAPSAARDGVWLPRRTTVRTPSTTTDATFRTIQTFDHDEQRPKGGTRRNAYPPLSRHDQYQPVLCECDHAPHGL